MEDIKLAKQMLKKRQKIVEEDPDVEAKKKQPDERTSSPIIEAENSVEATPAESDAKKGQVKKKRVLPGHFTEENEVGKLEFTADKPGGKKPGERPKVEKTDDLKLARELLKKRKNEKAKENEEPIEGAERNVGKLSLVGESPEKKKSNFVPKQEKVDDIKLAKELLKRRKEERTPSPIERNSPSPVPVEPLKTKQEKKKRCLPGHFTEESDVGKLEFSANKPGGKKPGVIPKVEKTDDLKLAREMLKKRQKTIDKEDVEPVVPEPVVKPEPIIEIPEPKVEPPQEKKEKQVGKLSASRLAFDSGRNSPSQGPTEHRRGSLTKDKEVGKLDLSENTPAARKPGAIPKIEKTDDLKLAREMLKKRQRGQVEENEEEFEKSRSVGRLSLQETNPEEKKRNYRPKQEKVDDLKLAKELLKKRQKERTASESSADSRTSSPVPNIPEKKVQEKKKRCLPGHFTEKDDVGKLEFSAKKPGAKKQGVIPKVEKTDDLKLAREMLKKRQKTMEVEAIPEPVTKPAPVEVETPKVEPVLPVKEEKQVGKLSAARLSWGERSDEATKTRQAESVARKEEREVGKLSWAERKEAARKHNKLPPGEKIDDIKMARQMLRRRQKSVERMEEFLKGKKEDTIQEEEEEGDSIAETEEKDELVEEPIEENEVVPETTNDASSGAHLEGSAVAPKTKVEPVLPVKKEKQVGKLSAARLSWGKKPDDENDQKVVRSVQDLNIQVMKERALPGHFRRHDEDEEKKMSWTSKRPGGKIPMNDLRLVRTIVLPQTILEEDEEEEEEEMEENVQEEEKEEEKVEVEGDDDKMAKTTIEEIHQEPFEEEVKEVEKEEEKEDEKEDDEMETEDVLVDEERNEEEINEEENVDEGAVEDEEKSVGDKNDQEDGIEEEEEQNEEKEETKDEEIDEIAEEEGENDELEYEEESDEEIDDNEDEQEEEEEEEEEIEEDEEESVEEESMEEESVDDSEERAETEDSEESEEEDKFVEYNLLTLSMISSEYRDIPDFVKFQFNFDGTLTDIDREFISRGKTFHARKARRHRLRRWQEEMAQSGLIAVIEAMRNNHELINKRTRRFMRNHGVVVPFDDPEDLRSAMNLI